MARCPEPDCGRDLYPDQLACEHHFRVLRPETQVRARRAIREFIRRPLAYNAREVLAVNDVIAEELSI